MIRHGSTDRKSIGIDQTVVASKIEPQTCIVVANFTVVEVRRLEVAPSWQRGSVRKPCKRVWKVK